MTDHRKRCPTCRQFLPLPRPHGLKLTPFQGRVLDIVRKVGDNGITPAALVDTLYADDPSGGPETALRCVYVQVTHLNKQLRPKGFEVRGNVAGQWGTYVYRRLTSI